MLVSFARQTIEVIRAPLAIDHAAEVRDWSNAADPVTVSPCVVDTQAGVIDTEHRTATPYDVKVLVPPGTDVLSSDHIRIAGYSKDFVIQNGVGPECSPTGGLDSILLILSYWEG